MTRTLSKKIALTVMLTLALLMLRPAANQAQGGCPQCPYIGCDMWSTCLDNCDYTWWSCYQGCDGYPDPYRTQCQDQCTDQYWSCLDNCQEKCYCFCS
jgi:hypothetical protein